MTLFFGTYICDMLRYLFLNGTIQIEQLATFIPYFFQHGIHACNLVESIQIRPRLVLIILVTAAFWIYNPENNLLQEVYITDEHVE
jgi:hypothetical protein